ncbi:hypothetical protein BaRGS_00018113 [Batillaria attramentaria]|uniref:Uncharacterized protein n=1 Tax=Batillaria attramentaria TaxID=370345 RepID=A0ABD0KUC1_9CAEN
MQQHTQTSEGKRPTDKGHSNTNQYKYYINRPSIHSPQAADTLKSTWQLPLLTNKSLCSTRILKRPFKLDVMLHCTSAQSLQPVCHTKRTALYAEELM